MNNKTKIGLIIALAGAASSLIAGDLTSYATGDVLICFRNGGANSGNGLSLVVDAGSIGTFTNYIANSRHTISAYDANTLKNDVGLNNTAWSAFTWVGDTLYVTRPNTNAVVFTQTQPISEQSSGLQTQTGQRMATIPVGAKNFGIGGPSNGNSPYSDSTATAVIEDYYSYDPTANQSNPNYVTGSSYYNALQGAGGSFGGTLPKTPESINKSTFTTGGKPLRADFYRVSSAGYYGLATLLGYFELNTNGAMSYVAYPTQTPVIEKTTFVRNNATGVSSFYYDTGTYGTYTLRGTNAAGLTTSPTNWPALGTLSTGDLDDHYATDTTTETNRFYSITAQ